MRYKFALYLILFFLMITRLEPFDFFEQEECTGRE